MNLGQFLKSSARRVWPAMRPALPFPDTLTIEPSYACNLRCVMCPRHFEDTPQGMMSMAVFRERVVPALGRFRYIQLAGWAEPLMHPDILEIVRLCKEAGCWVCFTSNGLLLREPLSRRLLETGIDLVNISIDGSTPDTYERIRGKGTFHRVLDRMREFDALRREFDPRPTLQWTFVMMKSTIAELPGAVRLAAEIGYERFIGKHMESAVTREGLAEALFDTGLVPPPSAEEEERFSEVVSEAESVAREGGIELEIHPRRYAIEGTCLARPVQSLFVDWQGYVSPCCHLNPTDVKPYIETPPQATGILGRVDQVSLVDLVTSPEYEDFRRLWSRGEIPEACQGCLQVQRMRTKP